MKAVAEEPPKALDEPQTEPPADEHHQLSDFACESPAMRRLLDLARRVCASDCSLLILGETGVGKEWLARAIHEEGQRASAPFVAVNCAALPETLLESELFGHERGAFTGAERSKRGQFELAHRGTLFLDEIGDMPLHLQIKLLRVLQDRALQRLGAEQTIAIDVRIVAATNRDLEAALAAGTFRNDLYYRLAVMTLTLPPLRERREDIPALLLAYLELFRAEAGKDVREIAPEALAALIDYGWPGNVRELINVMERAVLLCRGPVITPADLPQHVAAPGSSEVAATAAPAAGNGFSILPPGWLELPLSSVRREAVDAVERRYLSEQLRRTGGRVGEAALRAGLDPRSLYDKMKRLGISKDDFRPR
jgi:DNA-binding NtrC family response regulator